MSDPRRHGSEIMSSVSIPSDDDGFFGRECPERDCLAYFKLHGDEYHLAKETGLLSCPSCGIRANHETFMTPEQVQRSNAAIRELAEATAHQLLRDALQGLQVPPGIRGQLDLQARPAAPPTALADLHRARDRPHLQVPGRRASCGHLRPAAGQSVLRAGYAAASRARRQPGRPATPARLARTSEQERAEVWCAPAGDPSGGMQSPHGASRP